MPVPKFWDNSHFEVLATRTYLKGLILDFMDDYNRRNGGSKGTAAPTPMYILHGMDDTVIPPENADHIKEHWAAESSKVKKVSGVGHDADQFAPDLLDDQKEFILHGQG